MHLKQKYTATETYNASAHVSKQRIYIVKLSTLCMIGHFYVHTHDSSSYENDEQNVLVLFKL